MKASIKRCSFKMAGLVVLSLLLSACETVMGPAEPVRVVPRSTSNDREHRLGILSPQTLEAGECGMFLWSRANERNLILFSGRDGAAHVVVDGENTLLPRTRAEGAQILGQFAKQTFQKDQYTLQVDVDFAQRPGISRGAVVSQGSVRLTGSGGWETMIPTGGLVACEQR